MYVLIDQDTGKYVCPPGRDKSYSSRLQDAQQFPTREAANAQRCGNEYAAAVANILPRH